MTPEEFRDKMQEIFGDRYDTEDAHLEADDLMCKVLTDLGYGEGVEIFTKAEKWYA